MDKKQNSLFEELKEDWQEHWEGMPEFVQQEQDCYVKIIIRFRNEDDLQDFAKKLGQKVNNKTKSIWHPKLTFQDHYSKRYKSES